MSSVVLCCAATDAVHSRRADKIANDARMESSPGSQTILHYFRTSTELVQCQRSTARSRGRILSSQQINHGQGGQNERARIDGGGSGFWLTHVCLGVHGADQRRRVRESGAGLDRRGV